MTDGNSQQEPPVEDIDPDKFQEMVAKRAYCKAEKRGFEPGHELQDWLEAEQEVNSRGTESANDAESLEAEQEVNSQCGCSSQQVEANQVGEQKDTRPPLRKKDA